MKPRSWHLCIIVGLLELLLPPHAVAQEGSRLGVGVAISDLSELVTAAGNVTSSSVVPTIFVPIKFGTRMRLEPEIGFGWSSQQNQSSTPYYSSRSTASVLHVGAGVFAVAPTDRFAVYYGARVAYLHDAQNEDTGSATFPSSGNGVFVAPTLGGEYFLGDRVSLGAEIQVRYTSVTEDRSAAGTTARDIKIENVTTRGALTLRVWFPGR